MVIRMRNQRQPKITLNLTGYAWSGILELAVDYGWNPMGAMIPGRWHQEFSIDSYFPENHNSGYSNPEYLINQNESDDHRYNKQVLFEDALNLADALEYAFLDYEPVRVPASYYLFEPEDPALRLRPGIGAVNAVIDFCRQGSFWLEPYQQSSGIPIYAGD